jgi:hypothetical protein
MEPILAKRYNALLLAYEAGGGKGDLERLNERIRQSTPTFLREDAALMLVVLYDQMILRPYTGPIPSPSGDWMPVPKIGHRGFPKRVTRSLDAIFKELEKTKQRPISSHQVLKAIVKLWPTISKLFAWA